MCRKLPFDEDILDGWLEQSNIWVPADTRACILAAIDKARQDLDELGFGVDRWGPVGDDSSVTYFHHVNDYGEWVHEPDEDTEQDRLRKEDLARKEALSREKGKTIVIKLVDTLWPLYWDSARLNKLPGVVRIMRQPFHCRPFDEFSEGGYERIKVHAQRASQLDADVPEKLPSSATPRAKRRRSPIDDPVAPTKKFIREYYADDGGVSQKDLCERMASRNGRARANGEPSPYPMPKGNKFSRDDDDWQRAYLDGVKRPSLQVWLTRQKRDS